MICQTKNRLTRRLGLALGLCLCVGCGVKTYPVSGTVEFADGKPATELASGIVSFRSLDDKNNPSAQAVIQPDGTFLVRTFKKDDGLVPGKHQVAVTPPHGRSEAKVQPPPAMDLRFMKFETSGLEINVAAPMTDLKVTVERFKKRR